MQKDREHSAEITRYNIVQEKQEDLEEDLY